MDPNNGVFVLDNSGHGTGTLGVLAGGPTGGTPEVALGGAAEAEVLPVRISDRVVLLRTSALAAGLQYADDSRCDVITLSMGGLPSRLWGEVIDELYERGVCICAAAGNYVGSSPPRVLVYPARYPRVIAVCGVMADGRPYADLDGVLEGSFGPASVMGQAIAAYTPISRGHSLNEGESDSMARAPRQRHRRLPRRLPCGSKATSSGFRGTGGASRRHGTHSFPPPGRAMPRTSATASSKRIHRAKSAALGRAHGRG